ncbi:13345_t:CDS:2 [Rhizophagus irregularis]|nr:13345_t:CDS:2 [Rhizophagus irregularis]
MDFHILLGVEKMDITLKKILVVNYIEGDDEFILGNDFIRDFDVEIEDVYDKQLLRQLKFTVQLNEIDDYIHNDFDNINDEATSSISAGSNAVRKRRMKEKNVDDLTHHDDAYASSADNVAEQNNNINSRTSRTISSIPDERCKYSIDRTNWITNEDCEVKCLSKAYHLIFKDDVDWLITLENDAASLNTSLTSTNERCLNKLKRKSPIYDLELISDNMYNIRASYKSLLKYYGNDLWTQRERHIKDIKTIVEFSPSDWLLFFINQRKKRIDYINKLFLSISENDKNENFVNMMEDIHIELINIIDDIKKALEKQQSEDNIFDCLDLLMTELNYAKLYTEKLREKNIIINHIFMKLKVDIIKILEKRNFNNDEIEIINHFLEQEQINRNIFLENI